MYMWVIAFLMTYAALGQQKPELSVFLAHHNSIV